MAKTKEKNDDKLILNRQRIDTYMQETSNIFAENKLMRFVCVAMVVITLVNSMMLQKALDSQRTILRDPITGEEMWLSANDAADTYLTKMSSYAIYLTTQINAGNVDRHLNEALLMIHPSTFSKYQERFNKLKKEVKRWPTISHITDISGTDTAIQRLENQLIIDVNRKRIVGNQVTKNERKKYQIDFVIENGRFWILELLDTTGQNQTVSKDNEI